MKIGLLTIWREKNFGAEMQAYATIKALQNLGHDVEMIDFRLSDIAHPTIKQRIIKILTYITKEDFKFRKFWKNHIPKGYHYKKPEELKCNPPKVDLLLVGSDQVWNPSITKEKALTYFLDFGETGVRKASYASSFGESEWLQSKQMTENVAELLGRFSLLSCRETSGVEILKNTFRQDASTVLDPTLLHTEYPELTGKLQNRRTLVFYPLSPFPELETFCKETAAKLGLDYVDANHKNYLIRKIVWDRPGVEEWVRTIAEAELVITPSFHGLAFSLIYHRQFVIVLSPEGKKRSTRLTSLLVQLGLEDRLFTSVEDVVKSNVLSRKINYEDVDKKLTELRSQSYNYLKRL